MNNSLERKLQQAANQWNKTSGKQKDKTLVVPLQFALKLVHEFSSRSVSWDVEDFELRAREIEAWEHKEDFDDTDMEVPEAFKLFDRAKFEDILLHMIKQHDCNNGITWNTIDDYLNNFCRK